MDPFVSALEELSQALTSGDDPEQALAEIAEEHGLAAHALRNRAVRAFGPLETYQERQAALKQERQRNALRSDPTLAAASFLAESPTSAPSCRKRNGMQRSSGSGQRLALIQRPTEARSVASADATKEDQPLRSGRTEGLGTSLWSTRMKNGRGQNQDHCRL